MPFPTPRNGRMMIPMASPSPAGVGASAKVAKSRKAVESFLRHQEQWLERAEKAGKEGYRFETIGICQNQIHAMLRRGLWLQAQNQALLQSPRAWKDDYLFDLLLDSSHEMMEGARDLELYSAAQRFEVIDAETAQSLSILYKQASFALREIFSYNQRQKRHPPIEDIAAQLLALDRTCLENLRTGFAEFDTKIDAMLAEMA
jgi:hypothetical protein